MLLIVTIDMSQFNMLYEPEGEPQGVENFDPLEKQSFNRFMKTKTREMARNVNEGKD